MFVVNIIRASCHLVPLSTDICLFIGQNLCVVLRDRQSMWMVFHDEVSRGSPHPTERRTANMVWSHLGPSRNSLGWCQPGDGLPRRRMGHGHPRCSEPRLRDHLITQSCIHWHSDFAICAWHLRSYWW